MIHYLFCRIFFRKMSVKKKLKEIVLFLFLFVSLPPLLTKILVSVSGTADYKIVFMFCSAAFLATYLFKDKVVNRLFRPQGKVSGSIYFVLAWLVMIFLLRLLAQVLFIV